MLGNYPDHDGRALAAEADKLWSYHSHQQLGSMVGVATISSDDEDQPAVAAIRSAVARAISSAQPSPVAVAS